MTLHLHRRPAGRRLRRRSAGVSLVEAMVALAVMAFGVLGVAGVQLTLRHNSDVSRERAEAVRIAQRVIEQWRAYTRLDSAPGQRAYADITSLGPTVVIGLATTTEYTVTRTVIDMQGGVGAAPRRRTVRVEVAWTDRTATVQTVRLASIVHGAPPLLAPAVSVPADRTVLRRPLGRALAIPQAAVDQGDGTSSFTPPGADDSVRWVFDNLTGEILRTCVAGVCTSYRAQLLSGFVQFATGAAPTVARAIAPDSPALPVQVVVNVTAPRLVRVDCFEQSLPAAPATALYVRYFCAIPLETVEALVWTGRAELELATLSTALADTSAARHKVCRYTPRADDTPGAVPNAEHPLDYVNVTAPLVNQNYLVISAGDGSVAYTCPDPASSTGLPFDPSTYRHQPRQ